MKNKKIQLIAKECENYLNLIFIKLFVGNKETKSGFLYFENDIIGNKILLFKPRQSMNYNAGDLKKIIKIMEKHNK